MLLLVCVFVFLSCGSTGKLKQEVLVTYNVKLKKGEAEVTRIDSLKAEVVRQLPNGNYIVTYTVSGQIINNAPEKYRTLTKVRLSEFDLDISTDVKKYDRLVVIAPVQGYFFGKAPLYQTFRFKNEFLVDFRTDKRIKKVMFSCGDKEYLLELP